MALVDLHHRHKSEKEAMVLWLRSGQSEALLAQAYSRLHRQCLLLGDESKFIGAAVAVGLAEKQQQYKSNR